VESYERASSVDLDGVRRELVSACFLEMKQGNRLYFPHRTFQEFLVAEYIILKAPSPSSRGRLSINRVSAGFNKEVVRFLRQHSAHAELSANIREYLAVYRGQIGPHLLELIHGTMDLEQLSKDDANQTNLAFWMLVAWAINEASERSAQPPTVLIHNLYGPKTVSLNVDGVKQLLTL